MDGVEELNNIFVIGMTNRLDLIDEALLRPGRLEIQLEIGLPDEEGRLQILNIHTEKVWTTWADIDHLGFIDKSTSFPWCRCKLSRNS